MKCGTIPSRYVENGDEIYPGLVPGSIQSPSFLV